MSESDQSTIRMPVSNSAKSNPPEDQVIASRKKRTFPWRVSISVLSLLALLAGAWGAAKFLTVSVLVEHNEAIADLDDLDFSSPGFNSPGRFDSRIPGSKKSNRLPSKRKTKSGQAPLETAVQSASEIENPSVSAVWLTGQIERIETTDESTPPEQIAEQPDPSAPRR